MKSSIPAHQLSRNIFNKKDMCCQIAHLTSYIYISSSNYCLTNIQYTRSANGQTGNLIARIFFIDLRPYMKIYKILEYVSNYTQFKCYTMN